MAEVWQQMAITWFENWQRKPNDGPVLGEDIFAEFVRQSFHLDLDGLVGVPELYVRSPSEKFHDDAESVVGEVTKEQALLLAGAELKPEPTLTETEVVEAIAQLECDENVGAWAEILLDWLRSNNLTSAALVQLEQYTGLSMVKLLLAGLLDQDVLEIQVDEDRKILERFYDREGVAIALIA